MKSDTDKPENNEDHPTAFLGGGAAGAVAGAAAGSLAGPAGTVIGAAIGGFAGAETAEAIASLPEEEDRYWRDNYGSRPYAKSGRSYDDYKPGFLAGYRGFHGRSGDASEFDDVEDDIRSDYESNPSNLPWDDARPAARDAWERSRGMK